ncbi:MAG TPA: beta-galactosidase, partial [Gemmataceae bacterium]|nr:beta-galactosidase [Gemmataceae bacterium]
MSRWSSIAILLVVIAVPGHGAENSKLVPFVLPWDDASPGVTNVSAWLHKPAGKFGPIHAGSDGHLLAGDQRIRFLGVNLCFAATIPQKEDAPKIAARMARFGINVVRFHHMDMFAFPAGIRARHSSHTSDLDPEALERLDFLIAQLKRNGIYSNLNLLVSRPFKQSDGLPAEIERVDPKTQHAIGFFYEPMLRLQKEYARNLLGHRNPYTQLRYAEDPAVAFVEINNENGLLQGWLGNQVDSLPQVFLDDLRQQWNAWLRKQYASTDKLHDAWGIKNSPPGAELLVNSDFSDDTRHWSLEQHAKAKAFVATSADFPAALRPSAHKSARIAVAQSSPAAWHV